MQAVSSAPSPSHLVSKSIDNTSHIVEVSDELKKIQLLVSREQTTLLDIYTPGELMMEFRHLGLGNFNGAHLSYYLRSLPEIPTKVKEDLSTIATTERILVYLSNLPAFKKRLLRFSTN